MRQEHDMRIKPWIMRMQLLAISLAAGAAWGAGANYTYDAAGHLIKVDYGSAGAVSYSYDPSGNMVSRSVQTGNAPTITSVATANGGSDIAQNTFIVIKGVNLVPANTPAAGVIWNTAPSFAQGQMPTQLGGVSVMVNNKPAYIYFYCSAVTSAVCASDQINILTPLDDTTGPVPIVVTSGSTSSGAYTANLKGIAPAFLLFGATNYVASTHSDYTLLGPASLYPGSSTPAQPGETILLYAVGFGLPSGTLTQGSSMQAGSLATLPVCQVGTAVAQVAFAGLISSGLYQLNVQIPTGTPAGDNSITCTYGGVSTPPADLIAVHP
jgi:uncharacterized protein (TIGR03437 family)